MARHTVAAQAGMGVRRRRVSRWGARCLRDAGCRDVSHCVGDHEPRRSIDDPRRGSRAGFRPTCAPDARPTRSWFRRADPRLRHPGRPRGEPFVFRLRDRRGVDAARRTTLRRFSPSDRFRREARPATVLRMVSRRLRRGKRCHWGNSFRRRSQCRLLCVCARIDRLAAGRSGSAIFRRRNRDRRHRRSERHTDRALRFPAGRMARALEPVLRRERIDRSRSPRRGDHVPPGWTEQPCRSRLDRGAPASRRPCARQGRDVPVGRRSSSGLRRAMCLRSKACFERVPGCSASAHFSLP